MITLKNADQIAKMRESGRLLARVMRLTSESIVPGKTKLCDLDALAEGLITGAGAIPSFKGYGPASNPFPASVCTSVNDEVVHGVPDDRTLVEGDIVSLDFGVILDDWHADSAWTFPVGTISADAQRLLNITRESLMQGIAKARVGGHVGDISAAVQKYVEANGCSIVRDLVGHGIGRRLHEEPSVPNFGRAGRGPVLRAGMTMCIEPMVNQGRRDVITREDGWTVATEDGTLSAHFEHVVAVTAAGPLILTTEED
jgi:methionyl aminopeptidase